MLELDFVSGAYKDQLSLLQPYMRRVELAEGAVEVSEVLEEALAAPGLALYVPLLQKPKVQDLTKDPKGEAWFRLGKLFAHGTYLDYLQDKDQLPSLSPALMGKLRQLSILTLGKHQLSLPYEKVSRSMELSNVHEIEEIIVEAMETGLMKGKLDQYGQQLYLTQCVPREIPLSEIGELLSFLHGWADRVDGRVQELERQMERAKEATAHSARDRKMEKMLLKRMVSSLKDTSKVGGRAEEEVPSSVSKRERRHTPVSTFSSSEWGSEEYVQEMERIEAMKSDMGDWSK